MADKKTFRVTVARTITYINDVYVEAGDPQEAVKSLDQQIKSRDSKWFDPVSWGESYFYGVEKQFPDPEQFKIIEAEEE